jgi:histidinol-phosphate/aromatic aminotransferase/cobyric acid decarboxylase-like protein
MGSYGLPDCLRITIGTEGEIAQLVAGLEAWLGRNDVARDEVGGVA